jgi:deoxyribose-phosphate aldolase
VTRNELAARIDHTLLRAHAVEAEIRTLCQEAAKYGFGAVSINPAWTRFCARYLGKTSVKVNPCVGFPLGANTAHIKVEETREAIQQGAHEIDMVINIGALKSGYPQFVEQEIAAVVKVAGNAPVKVILECSCLTNAEKEQVCVLAMNAGAAFVKTSTGFGEHGAKVEDVLLMRRVVGNKMGIKAAGGIRAYLDAKAMFDAGATRIGTSAGVRILNDMPK